MIHIDRFALWAFLAALFINLSNCKTVQRQPESGVKSEETSVEVDDLEQYDLSDELSKLKGIEPLLIKGAKESQGGLGQVLLVSGEKQMHSFPVNVPYDLTEAAKLELQLRLACPAQGQCEAWDRLGSIVVVHDYAGGKKSSVEILRFMTPYREGATWSIDVTDYASILSGSYTMRTYIESWSSMKGEIPKGWEMTVALKVSGKNNSAIRPKVVWPIMTYAAVPYGDPKVPTLRYGNQAPGLKGLYKKGVLRSIITGHGQANRDNCAEFCNKKHTLKVGGQSYFPVIWRDDCHTSVSPTQAGNYRSPRAGWCPGDYVRSQAFDVTNALTNSTNPTAYFPEPYTNSCRPGAQPCTGCMYENTCEYNQGTHTPPFWLVTANLVLYR